ncbi:MAG TPA: anthranilate phosphoribosyltransferase [Spirochaetota bacterium]|nr:anthranilate phosphoribosyltransferase [Spirochaetota bacterium]
MTSRANLHRFGALVMKLIRKRDLTADEARFCWQQIITEQQPDLQQGAFLAALSAKGETAAEIAASWQAIYELDTNKIQTEPYEILVDNCGTGMDNLKTFNISTTAAVIAAACGCKIARHGARKLTSDFGTVDTLEYLGIEVDSDVSLVQKSIRETGIGIFNGMSSRVHPRALGRILSQIQFGTTLNIAGSLANPAAPRYAVRGVYAEQLIPAVTATLQEIGFKRALVFYGKGPEPDKGIDEISLMNETVVRELKTDGTVTSYNLTPEQFGLKRCGFAPISAGKNIKENAEKMLAILTGKTNGAARAIVCLNAAAVIYISGRSESINSGLQKAAAAVQKGSALTKLKQWVTVQSKNPQQSLQKLQKLL